MSEKERVSASVDPEVANYLKQDHVNASGLINELVTRHMNGGASDDLLREFRMQQIQDEYKDAATTARRKLEQYNRLKEQDEKEQHKREEAVVEFVDWMNQTGEFVFADHEDVAELANKHFDGDRDKTIQRLKETAEEQGYDFDDRRFGL